jgi:hypothetical protein
VTPSVIWILRTRVIRPPIIVNIDTDVHPVIFRSGDLECCYHRDIFMEGWASGRGASCCHHRHQLSHWERIPQAVSGTIASALRHETWTASQGRITLLCAPDSPFAGEDPQIYPQGSMRLGTTVHPVEGPFDLDFVCQLAVHYRPENPMVLLDRLFAFFKASDRYKGMAERKNRCVRIVYADDFYMDILPACRDHVACETCIQVPDRELRCWKSSNPIGYAACFEQKSRYRMYKFAAARDMQPLPGLEATEEK